VNKRLPDLNMCCKHDFFVQLKKNCQAYFVHFFLPSVCFIPSLPLVLFRQVVLFIPKMVLGLFPPFEMGLFLILCCFYFHPYAGLTPVLALVEFPFWCKVYSCSCVGLLPARALGLFLPCAGFIPALVLGLFLLLHWAYSSLVLGLFPFCC